jgi:hypothetical protein
MQTSFSIDKDIALYPVDGHGLLLNHHNAYLTLLNPVATQIWQHVAAGDGPQQIIEMLHAQYDVPADILQNDLSAILGEWEQLGFIRDNAQPLPDDADPQQQYAQLAESIGDVETIDISYQIAELSLTIRYQEASTSLRLKDIFTHYMTRQPHRHPDIVFDVLKQEDVYLLLKDGAFLYGDTLIEHINWVIYDELVQLLYTDSEWMVAIHAGTMSRNGRTALMPAISGSGKSTLCTALMNTGYHYHGDDVAIIRMSDKNLMPLPTTLSIKTGSWDHLSHWHPELVEQEANRVSRNRMAKFLVPAQQEVGEAFCTDINVMVFPRYSAEEPPACSSLTAAEKYQMLIDAGIWFGQPVVKDNFEAFIDWVQAMPAYRIVYSSTEQALGFMEELL